MTEKVGSAAEEAAMLLAAAQEWLRARFDGEHLASGASECQVCPICQGVALLRQVRPETVEHLLDAAASVAAALKSTMSSPHSSSDGSRVQHIDIREG